MLSYRHSYHAGNFADVLKHAVLALLLDALRRRDTAFCYLDTHAGAGRYDLLAATAEKTGEWHEGIARLWQAEAPPAALRHYLEAVRALNPQQTLRYYPGSPRIARHLLRPQDRMVLLELHSSDYPLLHQEFAGDRQVGVHHQDGYQALKALLPPKEKRGLVLMDPSYEVKSDYEQVVDSLVAAHRRWPGGIYALWYPILRRATIDRLLRRFRDSGIRSILHAELSVRAESAATGMSGSGMLLINPPWKLDQELQALLPWLWQQLAQDGRGHWSVEWLVPE